MPEIIECIPNISEGADQHLIGEFAEAISAIEGVKLLHKDSGIAANRTVFTFAGEADAVFDAAFALIELVALKIDMRLHTGEHPRIGACDVCPFVPISGIGLDDLVARVELFAKRVHKRFNIPIFLYEHSAKTPKRKNLAKHRIGNYEQLEQRILQKKWLPDIGDSFNPKSGAIVMGARDFLVAYNINLNSKDAALAQEIAYDLRELGRPLGKKNGKTEYKAGALKKVKAIGWYIEDFKIAQVSINLIDFKVTPVHKVFETCKRIAKNYGLSVSGSELIGLIPKEALLEAGRFYSEDVINATENDLIQSSIQALGLNDLSPFDSNKRILEYVMKA